LWCPNFACGAPKFTDAPLAEGKFETYLREHENGKKPRALRLSRPQRFKGMRPLIPLFCCFILLMRRSLNSVGA
jgi:hypothetical protein